jgi:hypothetical protein
MPARIDKRPNSAVRATPHDDRLLAHVRRYEVAAIRKLGLMCKEYPATAENVLLLGAVYLWIGEDQRTDCTLVPIHQIRLIFNCQMHFHRPQP